MPQTGGQRTVMFALGQALIHVLCPLYLIPISGHTHRFITANLFASPQRGYVGIHPVVIPIFTAVLHNAHPRASAFNAFPKMAKNRFRHMRMADQIVRCALWLLVGEPADIATLTLEI